MSAVYSSTIRVAGATMRCSGNTHMHQRGACRLAGTTAASSSRASMPRDEADTQRSGRCSVR